MVSKGFGILTLAIGAAIVADILRNPKGTAAAGNATAGVLRPILNASLGYKV